MLTVSDQQARLKGTLERYAQPRAGRVAVMANQRHLWEELADPMQVGSVAPRIMILWAGEDMLNQSEPDCRRVERRWQVVVVRGHGFKDPLDGGRNLPFCDTVEEIRETVRNMADISDYEYTPSVRYIGTKPLPNVMPGKEASAFLDAVVVEFATMNNLPAIPLAGTE